MNGRPRPGILLRAALTLAPILALFAVGSAPPENLSPTLAAATYFERAGDIVIVADGFPASQRKAEALIPVRVAVLIDQERGRLHLTRASFQLIDESGVVHEAADPGVVRRTYRKEGLDAALLARWPIQWGQMTVQRWRVRSRFYPATEDGLRQDQVDLSGFTWFEDVVYFPRPASGLSGVMTLRVTADGLRAPVDVRFRVAGL